MLEQRFRSGRTVPFGQMAVKDICSSSVSPRTSSSISERSSWKTVHKYISTYGNAIGSTDPGTEQKIAKITKTQLSNQHTDFYYQDMGFPGI